MDSGFGIMRHASKITLTGMGSQGLSVVFFRDPWRVLAYAQQKAKSKSSFDNLKPWLDLGLTFLLRD
jgi:hypothetical protein